VEESNIVGEIGETGAPATGPLPLEALELRSRRVAEGGVVSPSVAAELNVISNEVLGASTLLLILVLDAITLGLILCKACEKLLLCPPIPGGGGGAKLLVDARVEDRDVRLEEA